MTIVNYNNTPMTRITEADYETLLVHLTDQVGSVLGAYRADASGQEMDAASDALTNTWQPELTAREWLAAAGERLHADTSECVGV